MSADEEKDPLEIGIAELLKKGAIPSLPPCENLVEVLPDELIPPPNVSVNTSDILEAVLKRIFATTNEPHVRAAREYIGWTKRSYEEVLKATREVVKRPSSIKVLGPNASYEDKERDKQALLRRLQVRQRLASFEIAEGGRTDRHVRGKLTTSIESKLYASFRAFLADAREVQAVAADLKLLPPSGTAELQVPAASYIHRGKIERQFKMLVEKEAKLIALVGFPGMGKTSIARALTQGSPFIEFYDGKPSPAHIQAALERYLPSRKILVTPDNAMAALSLLLTAESELRLVALDNLQCTAELKALPPDTAATVVATCRETGPDAPTWCKEIRIGAMEEVEATQLAENKHGSLSRADAQFVANSLDQYPLLISLACRLASVTGMNIRMLCRNLQLDPGNASIHADETLRDVVARAISFLREAECVAVDLLTCLSYAPLLTVEHLRHLVTSKYGDDAAEVRCANAISLLHDLALIEPFIVCFNSSRPTDESSSTEVELFKVEMQVVKARMAGVLLNEEGAATFIRIHPLVRSLLKNLLKEDVPQIYRSVFARVLVLATGDDAARAVDRQNGRDGSSACFFAKLEALTGIGRTLQRVVYEPAEEPWKKDTDKNKDYYEILTAKAKDFIDKESEENLERTLELFTVATREEHKTRFLQAGYMNKMLSDIGESVPDSEALLKDLYAGET